MVHPRYTRTLYWVIGFTVGVIVFSFSTKRWYKNQPNSFSQPTVKPRRGQGLFLVSAFYDDRAENANLSYVRLILVRNVSRFDNMQCALMDTSRAVMSISNVSKLRIGSRKSFLGAYHGEEIFSCAVSRRLRPAFVALVPPYIKHTKDALANATLPVQYPEKPRKKGLIINCVSVTFGRPDITRLIEWLEMQRLLGMDRVEIHTVNLDSDVKRVLHSYTKDGGDGFVNLLHMTEIFPTKYKWSQLMLISLAINDCLYRNMYRYQYVAVFDIDEIIFPRIDYSYEEMMNRLHKEYKGHRYLDFMFRNVYFFLNLPGLSEGSPLSVMTRHTTHVKVSGYGYSVKSIIDPRACVGMHNHYCWGHTPAIQKGKGLYRNVDVDTRIGANQHYKLCHFDEKECKQMMKTTWKHNSMLRMEHALVMAMKKKLQKLGRLRRL